MNEGKDILHPKKDASQECLKTYSKKEFTKFHHKPWYVRQLNGEML